MNIQELTEAEILALTSDQIDQMVKLRMAQEGIKFIPNPNVPIYEEVQEPDITVYEIQQNSNTLRFLDKCEVELLFEMLTKTTSMCDIDYNYDSGYVYFMQRSSERIDVKMETKKVYSIDLYNKVKNVMRDNKKLKKQYEELFNEHIENLNQAQKIREEISTRHYEVIVKYDYLNNLCKKMKFDYLPLADGNEDVAFNFLKKAYSMDAEQEKYVLENYKNVE